MDVSGERGDSIALEKSPSVDKREKLSNLQSIMSILAYSIQCTTLCEHRSIELEHPSKAFIDFMINERTSHEQFNRTR